MTLFLSLPPLIEGTLFFAFHLLMILLGDIPLRAPIPREELRTLIGAGFVTVVGIGLLFLRRWAAIYFSVPLFCFGLWLAVSSIEPIPFPWNLLYMTEGVSLMLPLIVTIRVWPQLSWRGKWFF